MWEGNRLKVLAGALTLSIIAPAMFLLFRFLFSQLVALPSPDFGLALSARLLSSAFMAFTVFLAVSSLISGTSTLFRSGETAFLLGMPFQAGHAALFRMFESWFYAGWSTILLGIPIIAAFASETGRPASAALAGILMLIPLVLVSVALGTVVMSLLSRVGGMTGLRRGAAGAVVLSAAGLAVFFQGMQPSGIVIPDSSASLDAVQRFVAGLPQAGHSPWPSALFASVLSSAASGNGAGTAIRASLLLWGEAFVVCTAAALLVCPGFRRMYSAVSGDSGRPERSLPVFRLGGPVRAMMEKDTILFLRDPVQLSQLGLLLGLFVLYAGSLGRFPLAIASRLWLGVAVYMNISFTGFVIATLLVRFCFPSTSLEGPGLNFLLQVPGARRFMLRSKWLQSFTGILPVMLLTGFYSTWKLGAGAILMAEALGSILLLCFALVSINISLGAIFPRFDDNSAASIASGQGGIIAAFASMGYVLVVVSALSMATKAYLSEGFRERAMVQPMSLLALFLVPVTAALTVFTMRGAYRSMAARDF